MTKDEALKRLNLILEDFDVQSTKLFDCDWCWACYCRYQDRDTKTNWYAQILIIKATGDFRFRESYMVLG